MARSSVCTDAVLLLLAHGAEHGTVPESGWKMLSIMRIVVVCWRRWGLGGRISRRNRPQRYVPDRLYPASAC